VGPSAAASAPAAPQSANCLRNPRPRERSQDQRQRGGCESRGAESLQDSGGDEHAGVWGDGADRRRDREDAHAAEKDTAPTEAIGPAAGPDHPRRNDDRVTGQDPRQRGCTDFGEVTTDAAERDVENHRVEGRDEGGSGDNRKARPRAGSDLVSGREPVTIHGPFV